MKLAELVFVIVPGLVENEHVFSALKRLKSPQRNSLKEKHTNVRARGFKSMEYDLMSFPYSGRWLDAKKKCGRYMVQGMVVKGMCMIDLLVGDMTWVLGLSELNTWC
eukprot:85501-Pelagomonas_calceolata.AAC.2